MVRFVRFVRSGRSGSIASKTRTESRSVKTERISWRRHQGKTAARGTADDDDEITVMVVMMIMVIIRIMMIDKQGQPQGGPQRHRI